MSLRPVPVMPWPMAKSKAVAAESVILYCSHFPRSLTRPPPPQLTRPTMLLALDDITVTHKLHDGANSLVYRGQQASNAQAIILKFLKTAYPSPHQRTSYRQEYALTQQLNHIDKRDSIIQVHDLRDYDNRLALVVEDFGGQSLDRWQQQQPLGVEEVLTLALELVETLAQIHGQGVVHRDINPSNLVLNRETGQFKLIDFGIALDLQGLLGHRSPEAEADSDRLEGTLAYLAPEQTGRLGKAVDYRTDYYSLGVTLYELLTQSLPFQANDPLGLVHCHLAKPVPPLDQRNPGLSACLNDVVLKLMAKTPEARYQSAHGIHADLEACLAQLGEGSSQAQFKSDKVAETTQESATTNPNSSPGDRFSPGQRDQPLELQLPQRLYGREIELNHLQAAWERAYYGCKECILVQGEAGTGKSALVQALRRCQRGAPGYFIGGKFDQLQRDQPYSAIAQALESLVQQWLSEPLSALNHWRDQIITALGNNAQALVDLIPSLEKIIGPQPALIPLPPQESDNRFKGSVQAFLQAICRKEHPLILFLDDLQWADTASLNLIQLMLCQAELHSFLLIGAFRQNEVGPSHPLRLTLSLLKHQPALVQETQLKPLSLLTANRLIADTVRAPLRETESLAQLVFDKTQGNPFFLKEFLRTLQGDRQLWFDVHNQRWQWDLDQIHRQSMTDNVVELMTQRISQLPAASQDCLTHLACLGNRAALKTLAMAMGQETDTTFGQLKPAIAAGLVVSRQTDATQANRTTPDASFRSGDSLKAEQAYGFVHDRIQEAAYGSLAISDRSPLHWRIGHRLLKQPSMVTTIDATSQVHHWASKKDIFLEPSLSWFTQSNSALRNPRFEVINQLNRGRQQLQGSPPAQPSSIAQPSSNAPSIEVETETSPSNPSQPSTPSLTSQRLQLQALNLWAGQQAQQTVARQSALDYLTAGMALYQETTDWQHYYGLTWAIHRQAAEAALLAGKLDTMEQWIAQALPHCNNALDAAPFYQLQVMAAMMRHQPRQALDIALPTMASLGVVLPTRPNLLHLIIGSIKVKWLLRGKSDAQILALTDMTDAGKIAALSIANYIGTATYMTAPELRPILTFAVLQESLRHGPSPNSALGYASYGIAQAAVLGNIPLGVRFGNLALKLNRQRQDLALEARTVFLVYFLIRHWQEPLRHTIEPLRHAYQAGLEGGDYEYAATCLYASAQQSFICGDPLEDLAEQFSQVAQAVSQLQQDRAVQRTQLYQQVIACLRGQVENPTNLRGSLYDDQAMEKLHLQQQDYTTLFLIYLYRLTLCYLLGDTAEALRWSQAAEPHEESAMGAAVIPIYHFYSALSKLDYLPQTTGRLRKNLDKQIKAHHQKFKLWASHAPMNQKHRELLIQAERDRLAQRTTEAMNAYDEAIQLAQSYNYRQDEALANELAARFYLSQGQQKVARTYLQDAHYSYECWGALAKTKRLEAQYGHVLPLGTRTARGNSAMRDSINREGADLDLMSVTKASQMLSGEMQRDRLLTRLMEAILENAGAEAGYLALVHPQPDSSQWRVEAAATIARASSQRPHGAVPSPQPRITSDTAPQQIEVLQGIPLDCCEPLPQSIINYVIHSQDSIVLGDALEDAQFGGDLVVIQRELHSILCIPLLHQGKLIGLIYLENNLITDAFTEKRIKVIRLLCSQAAISLDNSRLYAEAAQYAQTLEQKVIERTAALEQANQKLHRLATLDSLTHLANRRSFDEYLEEQWQQQGQATQPLTVILCDVDYFKRYNDHYGHQAGDHCLQEIARAMERVVKRPNDLVARYGGEEFVIVLPNTPQDVAIAIAKALGQELKRLALPHEKSEVATHVSLSQGICSLIPSDGVPPETIVAQADEALYSAKAAGRNRHACYS